MKNYKILSNTEQANKTEQYYDANKHINRQAEIGIINPETGAFMASKEDGEVVRGTSNFNQVKQQGEQSLDVSTQRSEVCNRKEILTDDIIINNQKLNMQLLNISGTDMLFEDPLKMIGGFTVGGTVLVKVWEKHLNRYVLMRRPIRTPMFSNSLGLTSIPDTLGFDIAAVDRLDTHIAELIKSERDKEHQITDEMEIATGGSNYDQGDYDNYNPDSSNSNITNENVSNNPYDNLTTSGEVINQNPNKKTYCWPCPNATNVGDKIGAGRNHDGWDIRPTNSGDVIKICASRAGIVEVVNQKNGGPGNWNNFGACVVINHGDGIKTLYAHLKANSAIIKKGQEVTQGEVLGIMGSTGRSTGVHLHFSIYSYNSKGEKTGVINPEGLISPSS